MEDENTRDIVVVLDENEETHQVIKQCLDEYELRYYKAKDEADAVRSMASFRNEVAALVTEARLPAISGLQILENTDHLKSENKYKTFGMTEKPGEKLLTSFIDKGADDFLSKPIDKDVFCNSLEDHLFSAWHEPIALNLSIPFSHPFFKVKTLDLVSYSGLTFKFKCEVQFENQKMLKIKLPLRKILFKEQAPEEDFLFQIVNTFKDHGGYVYYTRLFGIDNEMAKKIVKLTAANSPESAENGPEGV